VLFRSITDMRAGLLLLCLAGHALSVPLRNSGKAPFQGDYETKDSVGGVVDTKNSETRAHESGIVDLPAAPLGDKMTPDQVFRAQNEIALLMAREPVPGSPPVEVLPVIPEVANSPMMPADDEPLDADCDSLQLGDVEPYPQAGVIVNMNKVESNATVPEQDAESREVLMDSDKYQPVPKENATRPHPTQPDVPLNDNITEEIVIGRLDLPAPDVDELRRNKCSRSTNGNDVPDPLGEMGEECGMPEPAIPCETAGNSTKCEPNVILKVPVLPPADKMPPIPVDVSHHSYLIEMAVEFPDFGKSVTLTVPVIQPVMDAVIRAGQEFELEDWHVLMIRNAGAQVDGERKVFTLEDQRQLVVYLRCAKRSFLSELIVRLPACEDYDVKELEVRIEVPETDDVFVVASLSTDNVENVLLKTPIPHKSISKVTYNGARVQFNQTLTYIRFANRSALVVYLTPQASAEHAALTDCNDKLNHGMETAAAPSTTAEDVGITLANPAVPIPPSKNELERAPMKDPAVVWIHIDGQTQLNFPVLVFPEHFGLALFDAIKERTGRPFSVQNLLFLGKPIQQDTPLKPLGLLNDDVVNAVLLPPAGSQMLPASH